MLSLKKTALAVLALGIGSSAAFAGTMGPVCTPGNVTVPCETTAWDVGIQALYIQPVFSGQPYDYNFLGYTTNGDWLNFVERKQDWNWGFRLEGSYHFGTGSDFNINWSHYDHTTRTPGNTYQSLISGAILAFDFNDDKINWDAVNAEFAQHVDFGAFKNIRFHGGLQYAYLKYNNYGVFIPSDAPGLPDGIATYNQIAQKFNGVGPRAGMDMSYDFTPSFALYGKIAGALLMGDVVTDDTSAGIPPFIHSSSFEVIPELETKLGGTFTYNMAQGNLIFDAGYMVVNYFNVLDRPANLIGSTNVAFQGPYFGLKYIGSL